MEESPAQMKKGTLNLMMFAYSSTNTKTDRKKDFFLSRFMCQVSHLCIMCHVLCVTCHLSPATDPPTDNSPTMHSRQVCKSQKSQKSNSKSH